MRAPTIARTAAVLVVAAAIAATEVHLRHGNIDAADRAAAAVASLDDHLARELARCRRIGIAAQGDAACEAAWAENRRRFFAPLSVHLPADIEPNLEARQPQ